MKHQDRKKGYLLYLGGLMLATVSAAPALAATPPAVPPPPRPSAHAKVDFAANLQAKIAQSAELFAWWPWPIYTQKFGQLYVQTTFTEVQPPRMAKHDAPTLTPSEAYRLISKA
jgi:hypothetical protein